MSWNAVVLDGFILKPRIFFIENRMRSHTGIDIHSFEVAAAQGMTAWIPVRAALRRKISSGGTVRNRMV